MLVMGIETATPALGVALVDGSGVVAEACQRRDRAHAEQLLPLVREVLSGAGLQPRDVEGLAVSAGPGSFTGLRIGLALAKGWAYAAGIPLCGVPTLDALAHLALFAPGLVCAALDARRGQVYSALYRSAGEGAGDAPLRLGPYRCLEPGELLASLPGELEAAGAGEVWFVGDALSLPGFWEGARALLGARARRAGAGHEEARAWCVAALGRRRLTEGWRDDPFMLLPLYVSPPSARPPAAGRGGAVEGRAGRGGVPG
ncbi:MAG: tRNA (adenosine(37)-N6)-threonylcarbamoyltransferase complex dimerization subunit type 1 TsaB [Acetobacteraceae bacterium]|nr:tRNA (adenosine(37)-N6)-threonylcarbamoyltransferase complex dimerization subunit type 1 TsaB [Acetobacteraceae bacterium]